MKRAEVSDIRRNRGTYAETKEHAPKQMHQLNSCAQVSYVTLIFERHCQHCIILQLTATYFLHTPKKSARMCAHGALVCDKRSHMCARDRAVTYESAMRARLRAFFRTRARRSVSHSVARRVRAHTRRIEREHERALKREYESAWRYIYRYTSDIMCDAPFVLVM